MGAALRLLGIGWFVALSLLGGALGGLWLDNQIDTDPLFAMLGLGAGLLIAGIGTYRMLTAVLKKSDASQDQGEG